MADFRHVHPGEGERACADQTDTRHNHGRHGGRRHVCYGGQREEEEQK